MKILNFHQEYLTLLQQTSLLLEEEPLILASPEDADFFRQTLQKKKEPQILSAEPSRLPPFHLPISPVKRTPKLETSTETKLPSAHSLEESKAEALFEKSSLPLEMQVQETPKDSSPIQAVKAYPSLASWFTLVSKISPETAILPNIPNDAIAKKIASRWKTKNQIAPITLLMSSEPETHQKLLKEISKALDIYFGPAKIVQADSIEKEKQWETFLSSKELKLIIICDYTLWQLNGLMQFYKEVPAQGTRLLGKIPLFLLPDLSLYLKDPLLKRSLWKALCQKIS